MISRLSSASEQTNTLFHIKSAFCLSAAALCVFRASTFDHLSSWKRTKMGAAGYLPASGGLQALQSRLARADSRSALVNDKLHAAYPDAEPHNGWAASNGAPRSAFSPQSSAAVPPPKVG